jgi:predicted phage terminase large subunit-like protein
MISYDAWMQEYLLKIVRRDDQVVQSEWISNYDELPSIIGNDFQYAVVSADLAIKENDSADYTALITAYVYGYESNTKIYMLPFPVNVRMDFPKTVSAIKEKYQNLVDQGINTKVFVEEVGYQTSLTQQLRVEGINAVGVSIAGKDKRERLAQTTSWIQSGKILFPKKGCEFLINQLIYFGVEKHDDLADAFSQLVLEVMKTHKRRARAWGPDCEAYQFLTKSR